MDTIKERIKIEIPQNDWTPCGGENADNYTKLHACIDINGAALHLEAFEMIYLNTNGARVDPNESFAGCTLQEPNSDMGEELEAQFRDAAVAFYTDGQLQTIQLFGREYAVFGCPGA